MVKSSGVEPDGIVEGGTSRIIYVSITGEGITRTLGKVREAPLENLARSDNQVVLAMLVRSSDYVDAIVMQQKQAGYYLPLVQEI